MNYNNFINNLRVGDIFLCMGQELTVRKVDNKTKIVELGHGNMSTMMSFDRLYDKYRCQVFHPYAPVKDIDPNDYYDTDLWFEVEDNKKTEIAIERAIAEIEKERGIE